MATVPCPPLDDVLRRAVARGRRRTLVAGVLGAFAAGTFVVLAMESARIVAKSATGVVTGHGTIFVLGAAAAAAVLVVAAISAWRAADEEGLARGIDARLGLPDVAATALAVARGRVESPLAPVVVAQAAAALDTDAAREGVRTLGDVRMARPARYAAVLAVAAWMVIVLFLVIDWLQGFGWPGGLLGRGASETGVVTAPDDGSDHPVPAEQPDTQPGDDDRPSPRPEPAPDAPPGADLPPPTPREPPPDREEPDVHVKARPSRGDFRGREPVLVVVSAAPRKELPKDRVLRLSLELDGKEAPTRAVMHVGPSAPLGVGEIQDLRRIPALADGLTPGEHQVRARLRDESDGTTYDSAPASFRIESDDPPQDGGGGGGGGGQQPPPPEQPPPPQPQPPTPDTPPPPPQAPPTAPPPKPRPGEEPPPEQAPPPKTPVKLDPQVVVPLFGKGEEVVKKGLRVVLVPGGGPAADPLRAEPLPEAIPEAARRAESQVDRAGVREADRDLVRRYFEELLRLVR